MLTLDSLVSTQTSLLRDRRGRVVLPPIKALDGNRGIYYFSDADLHAIYQETVRQRRLWRAGNCLRVGLFGFGVFWVYCIIQCAS